MHLTVGMLVKSLYSTSVFPSCKASCSELCLYRAVHFFIPHYLIQFMSAGNNITTYCWLSCSVHLYGS